MVVGAQYDNSEFERAVITADWPAPDHIIAGVTTCVIGVSQPPYAANNLALHVGDDIQSVLSNRRQLDQLICRQYNLSEPLQWQWLNQTHGIEVVAADKDSCSVVPEADASVALLPYTVCAVLTADCLPILITDDSGSQVAAIHAGWRSLCFGVIENTLKALQVGADNNGGEFMAWLGPAIGPARFEVGEDVREAFRLQVCGEQSMQAFMPASQGKYWADIYQLARYRLQALGIDRIYGGDYCTVTDAENFYSYRRDGQTGRMASFIFQR